MSETWRVSTLTPPGMGVTVDAWHQLPLDPAHPVYARTDLIAEQLLPVGDRDVQAFTGTASIVGELPPLPDGYRAIATIHVLPGLSLIGRCHIGAPRRSSPI